ncbi:MAG: SpaH/EbpB family LPXTG-anchored major pilin [Oscillospiraceae bacterium]|jgi:fimbrial isopeptide formation D2 family protein/LPXTG-motif cell wall-anchored protein|nr:SpaH/EbpB family LPXTG-anchored major pilin [Oscillospiraceae bacterium]
MKKITRIKSVLVAAIVGVILLASMLPLTALAANDALPPATGNLTIHKYLMNDISGATTPGDGTTNVTLPSGATPLSGIEFKIYRITLPSTGDVPDKADYPEPGYLFESYLNPTKMTSNGIDYALTPATVASVTTGSTGAVTASNLPQGLYLVVEQPDVRVVSPAAPFVVAVPMTNVAGDGWLQDVHVYPKNEDVQIHKTTDKSVVNVGDLVNWTIQTGIPTDIAAYTKFDIKDLLDEALDLNLASVKVEGLLTENQVTGTDLPASTYTVTYAATATNATTYDGNNNVPRKELKISFNKVDKFTMPGGTQVDVVTQDLAKYKFLRVTFTTNTNEKILDRVAFTVWNDAKVEFKNRFAQDKERITEIVKHHTGKVIVQKIDSKSGVGVNVNGAKFKIASSEQNAKDGIYLHVLRDAGGKVIKIVDSGKPGYNDAGMVDWEETTAGGTASTPATASFAGLADYTEPSYEGTPRTYLSYWLVETQAPAGYNLLAGPVQATFTAGNSTASTSYTISVTVKNTPKWNLPKTGGMGTILFTVGGVSLVGAAIVLLVLSAKKKKQEAQ